MSYVKCPTRRRQPFARSRHPPRPLTNSPLSSARAAIPGILWKIKLADRIFGPIAEQLQDPRYGTPVRLVLMVGDQIYANTLNRAIPIGGASA